MKTIFQRVVGILLIVAAIIGLVFSITGLAGIWRARPGITTSLMDTVDLVSTSLDSTAQGLALTQQSMKTLTGSVSSVKTTLTTSIKTFETTKPMLSQLTALLDNDLPNTVTAVQTSLDTAYQSAQIIDTVLHTLTFFNRDAYNPEVPLHEALQQVSASMDSLPASLQNMETSLSNTSDQVDIVQADLELVIADIESIESNLQQYDKMLGDYQASLSSAQKQLTALKTRLPRLVDAVVWVLTIFLLWMAFAQLSLLTQGWELVNRASQTIIPTTDNLSQKENNPE